MPSSVPLREGQTLSGPLFNEPMRIETVASGGAGSWVVGLVGAQSERFRRVTLSETDLATLTILDSTSSFDGDGNLLRLGIQAYSLGIAHEFDPYFGLSISKVDPLPHQLEAVYDYLLKLARVRFLLADDAGAGKTIMAGLLIRELKLRGLAERILIVGPANLAFQWQRELREKFDEKFIVLKGSDIRDQFGVNQWLEQRQVITSLDLAKRGEVMPAAHIERVLRDYYAGKLGDADLEDRLLYHVDEDHFRAICHHALEGLASKKLNLEMLIERRARAQERRVVPETIARFLDESAGYANLTLKRLTSLPHTFDPGKTPTVLRRYERDPDWRLPALATKYPRLSTDRDTAEENKLEWVTPGHPLFEAVRRHTYNLSQDDLKKGACFYSLAYDAPARIDVYRARVVDGLGHIIHERLFAMELAEEQAPRLREPTLLGDFLPAPVACLRATHRQGGQAGTIAEPPEPLPPVTQLPESTAWLQEHALQDFIDEVRNERQGEIERIAEHVELSLTELLQRADEEIGRAAAEVERKAQGAEGRLAQAESRHAELLARRQRRREELEQQRSLTLQAVERITSVLVLPHPERETPEVRRLRPNLETEATAMQVVMDYERSRGREVYDVHEKNLGYDITSLDVNSGELRLIEVKGIGEADGSVLLTPNELRVAQDRPDCFWLYVVTHCNTEPQLREPIRNPARFQWNEVTRIHHYWLDTNSLTRG